MSDPADPPKPPDAEPPSRSVWPVAAVATLVALAGLLVYALITGPVAPNPDAPDGGDLKAPALQSDLFLEDEIGFAPVHVDAEALAAARGQLPGAGQPPPKEAEAVLDAFRALNLQEIGSDQRAQTEAAREFNLRLTEFYGVGHHAGLQALMTSSFARFREALDLLVTRARSRGATIEDLVQQPDPALQEALSWAGGFVLLARRLGLMDPTGAIEPRLSPLVEVLYRYRIAQGLRGTLNPKELMTGQEIRTFFLWRLHEARSIPLDKRLLYAIELSIYLPGYPSEIARGALFFQAGHVQEARDTLARARQLYPDRAALIDRYLQIIDAQPAPAAPDAGPAAAPDAGPAADAPDASPAADAADASPAANAADADPAADPDATPKK